jgi:hypothetical protein
MTRRPARGGGWLAWGAAAAAVYIAAVLLSPHTRPAILLDGLIPIDPYRWAPHPWVPFSLGRAALSGAGALPLEAGGSGPGSVPTGDGQAVVVAPRGGFAPRQGDASVLIAVTPLHVRALPPPPRGLAFDGNAYRVEARYEPSGLPAVPVRRVTLLLSYPQHAEEVLALDGDAWTALPTTVFPINQKLFAEPETLGVFAAASPADRLHRPRSWWPYAAAAAAAGAAAAAWWAAARLRRITAGDVAP